MKVVFFGDGENVFSNRHFHALTEAGALTGIPQKEFPWEQSYFSSIPGEKNE